MRLVKLKAMKRINGLHFTPDGRKLLAVGGRETGSADAAVWVDVAEGAEARRTEPMAFNYAAGPDLKQVAYGNPSELDAVLPPVVVCDPAAPSLSGWRVVIPIGRTSTEVYALAFDPTGKRLAVSYSVAARSGYHTTFRLAVFPLAGRGKPVEVFDRSDDHTISHLAFSPDGNTLASNGGVGDKPAVKVWDAKTLALIRTFTPKGPQTRHLAYSPDGGTLAVVNGKSVFLHSSESATPHTTLVHPKQTNQVAFTPDGRRILSTCHDGLLRIWDADSGQLVTSYDWGIGQTTAVVVAPDGLTAAAAGQKGQIAVFDLV